MQPESGTCARRVNAMISGSCHDEPATDSRSPFSGFAPDTAFRRGGADFGVKICIQHQGTRKFLRGADSWVESMDAARHFENSMEALRYCVNNPVGQVNIIIDRGLARPPIIIAIQGAEAPLQIGAAPLRAAA
jgi:hypothetical protein